MKCTNLKHAPHIATLALLSFSLPALAQTQNPALPPTSPAPTSESVTQGTGLPDGVTQPTVPGQPTPDLGGKPTAGADAAADSAVDERRGVTGTARIGAGSEATTTVEQFNAMTEPTLESKMGLSAGDAAAIANHREANGDITSVDDLESIEGLSSEGAKTMQERIAFGARGSGGASLN